MPRDPAGFDSERRRRRWTWWNWASFESQQQPVHDGLLRVHLLGAHDFRMRFGREERSPHPRKSLDKYGPWRMMATTSQTSFVVSQISEHHYDVPHLMSPSPPPLPPGMMPSPECEPPLSLMSLASSPRPSSHSTMDKNPHTDSDRSLSSTLSSSCECLVSSSSFPAIKSF